MTAIIAQDISKLFRINVGSKQDKSPSVISRILGRHRQTIAQDLWALKDVSFKVEEGEVFGIIGRNGSGKSTLLKILTGIVRPTTGCALIRGRVGALLEVGTGFHPDLTGRENVYFSGTLLGLDRQFIKSKFDEIVEFAEVERFIDTQVKHYSSGMQSRLAFAVAANLRPEILILDEVLSVGDIMFQEKSMDRMSELRKSGITVLFVSHSLSSISGICNRAMLLKQGCVVKIGEISEVIDTYVPRITSGLASVDFDQGSKHQASFISARLENNDNILCHEFDISEPIYIRIFYTVKKPLYRLRMGLRVHAHLEDIFATWIGDEHEFLGEHAAGKFEKRLMINPMFLKEGEYTVTLEAGIPSKLFDQYERVLKFTVVSKFLDTDDKSYKRERAGKVICQGKWLDISSD